VATLLRTRPGSGHAGHRPAPMPHSPRCALALRPRASPGIIAGPVSHRPPARPAPATCRVL